MVCMQNLLHRIAGKGKRWYGDYIVESNIQRGIYTGIEYVAYIVAAIIIASMQTF